MVPVPQLPGGRQLLHTGAATFEYLACPQEVAQERIEVLLVLWLTPSTQLIDVAVRLRKDVPQGDSTGCGSGVGRQDLLYASEESLAHRPRWVIGADGEGLDVNRALVAP